MNLIGSLIIRCSSCGAKYKIDANSLYEDVSYIGEGGMDEQYQHTYAGEIECDRYGKQMSFCLIGYEYPICAKEYQDSESEVFQKNGYTVELTPAIKMVARM